MNKKGKTLLAVALVMTSAPAFAADNHRDHNHGNDNQSILEVSRLAPTTLDHEMFGFAPQIGILTMQNSSGDTESRLSAGVTGEMNVVNSFPNAFKGQWRQAFLGPSVGAIFSRIGEPDATLVEFPLDVKAGYHVTDNLRFSLHAGGNLTYRSNRASIVVEKAPVGNDAEWGIFPNFGGAVEWGIGSQFALILRPEVTVTPGNDFFTGTIGVNIPLGNSSPRA